MTIIHEVSNFLAFDNSNLYLLTSSVDFLAFDVKYFKTFSNNLTSYIDVPESDNYVIIDDKFQNSFLPSKVSVVVSLLLTPSSLLLLTLLSLVITLLLSTRTNSLTLASAW